MGSCIALGTIVTLFPYSGEHAWSGHAHDLGHIPMDDRNSNDDFAPAVLRARVDAWVEEKGRTELIRTIRSAEQTRDSIRAVLRVDQQTLNNPVTL